MQPVLRDAYQLMHDGALVLAEVEMNGFFINTDYCSTNSDKITTDVAVLQEKLLKDKDIRKWKRLKGSAFNISSNPQLAWFLYDILGVSTKGGRSVSEDTLARMDVPFIAYLLRQRKLEKVRGTYLRALTREATDGVVHPFFNVHNVRTYRSSSDSPNFQNFPSRDKEMSALVRNAIVPREILRLMGEHDFGKLEVCIGTSYHHDPTMIRYLANPDKYDMHRDAACWVFGLSKKQVTKAIRHIGKNGFVFPAFYGSYWKMIAEGIWRTLKRDPIKLDDGTLLLDWLANQGITELGTLTQTDRGERPAEKNCFYARVMDVEHRLWYELFPEYRKWRQSWYKDYCKRGYFDTLTGFRCTAPMARNDAINYPIQGSAFHCLLWSLIQYQRWLKKEKMGSLIVGQIHDSMVVDYVASELKACVQRVNEITGVELSQHWSWIDMQLSIETEVAPPGASLFAKKPYHVEFA